MATTAPREPKKRTLTYRRAVWHVAEDHDLQYYVRRIHQRLTTTRARTFQYTGGTVLTGMCFESRHGSALGHLAQFVPHDHASTIPVPSVELADSDAAELPPPRGREFLTGDLFFLVHGNNVLLCPSGARESALKAYLDRAGEATGERGLMSRCGIEPVANVAKLALIREEGVKSIQLDATLFSASLMDEQVPTVRRHVLSRVGDSLLDLFGDDPDLAQAAEDENITVYLEVVFDKRRKGGVIGQRRMQGLASQLVKEHEPGFRIVTGSGGVIESDELKIQQPVPLRPRGSSVEREHAWEALLGFLEDLRRSGALET